MGENLEIVRRLIVASKYKDEGTTAHVVRVGGYARSLADMLGASPEQCRNIFYAAQLHDIGKIGVPDSVLNKQGPLTNDEFATVRRHCDIGAEIIGSSKNEILQQAAVIARGHHECWDGSGYPLRLQGEKIPLLARVTMLADIYDALRSARPYKTGFEHSEAVRIILRGDGRTRPEQFDPELLQVFRREHEIFRIIFDESLVLPVDVGMFPLTCLMNVHINT